MKYLRILLALLPFLFFACSDPDIDRAIITSVYEENGAGQGNYQCTIRFMRDLRVAHFNNRIGNEGDTIMLNRNNCYIY